MNNLELHRLFKLYISVRNSMENLLLESERNVDDIVTHIQLMDIYSQKSDQSKKLELTILKGLKDEEIK